MARRQTSLPSSGATILVIDDQEEILISTRYLLEREGHKVLTASSALEGVALFRTHSIQLVIVDYLMPQINGEQCIEEIRKLDEDVQILLQTGYSGEHPPRDMLRALAIQGYHDKSEGPDRLLLWVDVALKAAAQLKKVREAEQAMADAHAQLRRLSARLLHIQEKERERISRELHDHLGQLLTAVGMNLDWVLRRCPGEPHPIHDRLQETRQLVQDVMLATRELSVSLRPGELHGLGLEAALQAYLSDFERRSGLSVHFASTFANQEIPSEVATNIYRIVQEALTNVVRYAEASTVRVVLEHMSSRLRVSVRDDGKGFDLHHVTDPHAVGLIGMQERARMLGGQLAIHSTPGAGTMVQVDIPLTEESTLHD
jgi:signal transduction histidine kinase